MHVVDWCIVGVYLAGLLAFTCVTEWRRRKQHHAGTDAAHAFFLAEQAAPWWAIAASYFASNIGSDAVIGLSSAGATVGIVAGMFDFASAIAFILLAYVFLPVYRRSGIFTMPEYTQLRFGKSVRVYLAVLALVLYVLSKISVSLFCGALLLESVLHVSPMLSIALLLLFTGAFTLVGGLGAVIHVEVINTTLLLVAGLTAAGIAMHAVGGWPGIVALANVPVLHDAGVQSSITPSFVHAMQSSGEYALPGLLLGAPFMILWFHACDQEMVQRGLASRSAADGRLGSVIAGFLKLTVPWTWCVPGIAARILFPDALGCNTSSGAAGAPCNDANQAFPALITRLLPAGVRGIMVAASVAGVLSVLASTFNSASTLLAMDLYRQWWPRAQPSTLVWIGRASIVVMTILSLLWLPLLRSMSTSLYITMQSLNAYVAPPIAVVFLAALFWPPATTRAALAALFVGHIAGAIRLLLTLTVPAPIRQANPFLRVFVESNFLYFAACIAAVCIVIMISVSAATVPPHLASVQRLMYPPAVKAFIRAYVRCTGRMTDARMGDLYQVQYEMEHDHKLCAGCGQPMYTGRTPAVAAGLEWATDSMSPSASLPITDIMSEEGNGLEMRGGGASGWGHAHSTGSGKSAAAVTAASLPPKRRRLSMTRLLDGLRYSRSGSDVEGGGSSSISALNTSSDQEVVQFVFDGAQDATVQPLAPPPTIRPAPGVAAPVPSPLDKPAASARTTAGASSSTTDAVPSSSDLLLPAGSAKTGGSAALARGHVVSPQEMGAPVPVVGVPPSIVTLSPTLVQGAPGGSGRHGKAGGVLPLGAAVTKKAMGDDDELESVDSALSIERSPLYRRRTNETLPATSTSASAAASERAGVDADGNVDVGIEARESTDELSPLHVTSTLSQRRTRFFHRLIRQCYCRGRRKSFAHAAGGAGAMDLCTDCVHGSAHRNLRMLQVADVLAFVLVGGTLLSIAAIW